MLDAVNAHLGERRDELCGVGVGRDRPVEGVGRVDDGTQLVVGQLAVLGRVIGREEAAGGHDLDKIRADLDLVAHGVPEKVRARAHGRVLGLEEAGQGRVGRKRLGGVAVAARRAQEVRRRDHARAREEARVDSAAHVEHVILAEPADMADGGEAARERAARAFGRGQGAHAVRVVDRVLGDLAPVKKRRVDVGVDHTRRDCQG